MHYYFDESGDWSGNERRRLVLGGLIIRHTHAIANLDAEFKLLKAEHNLTYLHANEMSASALDDCYSTINETLKSSSAAMIRVFSPRVVARASRKTADDVYIELAAELISTLIMGDIAPIVNYDMKFHYAYPENIVVNTQAKKPHHYIRVVDAHVLREDKYQSELNRIVNKINSLNGHTRQRLQWFLEHLSSSGPQAVSEYLWSELVLQVQGKEKTREIFRKTILDNLKSYNEYNTAQQKPESLQINYYSKDQGNAGIEMIDILCNLVYRYGVTPPDEVSNNVRRIYDTILVEEN
ncbi:MAG: DUF3800 domain-containing protein [Candidatus Cloacimonas sp.]|nr:DUF3800 domain-containing protein [Candidatus Cloacimonas sp.]